MTTKAQGWRKRQIADKQDENMSIEAMKQALEALEDTVNYCICRNCIKQVETITALRQALSEAQLSVNENSHAIEQAEKQEPVCDTDPRGCWSVRCQLGNKCKNTPAPQREWVGLTQQDIDIAFDDTQEGGGFDEFAEAIEQILKRKNT